MDLLAQKRVLFVLGFLLAWTMPGVAQDDLYRLSGVDYFSLKTNGSRSSPLDLVRAQPEAASVSVVAALLEDPNEGTARQYVAWSRERIARFIRAQQLVEAVEQEGVVAKKP